jgi:hypothetical protein
LFKGEKTTKTLERRQMKIDYRSSTISSETGIIQISTLALTTSIATATFVMVFFTYAPILTAAAATAGQAVPSLGKAPNNNTLLVATATTSNTFPTLGNPSEY